MKSEKHTHLGLAVRDLSLAYGGIQALHGLSFQVPLNSIVVLIGSNGAGKSSILNAIAGAVPYQGKISFEGKTVTGLPPEKIVRRGINLVPEGRRIFENLTVLENLQLAAWNLPSKKKAHEKLVQATSFFPVLQEKKNQLSGTLSGGEQQMLALGRALMTEAKLLLLDEPSMGLAPIFITEIVKMIQLLHQEGKSILLVEQNAHLALKLADYAYLLELGKITLEGTGAALAQDPKVQEAYLGKQS